ERTNTDESYPIAFRRPPSIFSIRELSLRIALEKRTFPLAIYVLAFANPLSWNACASSAIATTRRPPTFRPRRNATYDVIRPSRSCKRPQGTSKDRQGVAFTANLH